MLRCSSTTLRTRVSTLRKLATDAAVNDAAKPPAPPVKSRGGSRFLLWLGMTTVGGVSLTLAACDRSVTARKMLEEKAPQLTPLLKMLLGAHGSKTLSKRIGITPPDTIEPGITSKPSREQDSAPRVIATEARTSKETPKTPKATVAAAQTGAERDAKTRSDIKLEDGEIVDLNKSFEARLAAAMTSAENGLAHALEAKEILGEALLKQSQAVKVAVDDADAAVWELVGEANAQLANAQLHEQQAHTDATNYMDMLRTVLNDARTHTATASNAHIDGAQTTLGQLVVHLEASKCKGWSCVDAHARSTVRRAETEAKITAEYRRLIDESRRQFADELEQVLPHTAIIGEGDEMSEAQLNALVAHAHVKVDTLKRQLIEHQLREEGHITEALERQSADHERIYGERVAADMHAAHDVQTLLLERRLADARASFEEDLRNQLRRSAAAHSAHLEDVLAVHTAQLEAESTRRVQEAVRSERDEFHNVMSTSLQRLHTIEEALESRREQDAENRRAKELWLACQNLVESVVHGRKGAATDDLRRQPLANQLICIRETSLNDTAVASLFHAFPEGALKEGVYTEDDLCTRFDKVRRVCSRVAMVDEANASIWSFAVSALQSMLIVQRASVRTYAPDERIDLCNPPDAHQVFHRAAYHLLERHDLHTAVRLLSLLEGEPARLARSWLADARAHLEARQTAQLLLAHAAAQSLRTVY